MISPLAFKLAAVYLLPYIYIALHPSNYGGSNLHLTTSYVSIEGVNSVTDVTVTIINAKYTTKYITNATSGFILVDLPPTIGLCPMISMHAPKLACEDRDTVSMAELAANLNPALLQQAFGVPTFSYTEKQSIENLIRSGTYNYPFLVQSFPSLAVKLSAPVEIVEGNDCGAKNCSVPRYTDFFVDGARDTAIYFGTHLAVKHIYNPYVSPIVNRIVGPPLKYLSAPFRNWYNRALYAADHLTARGFDAGMSAAPENIALSPVSLELAEGLPSYQFSGPSFDANVYRDAMEGSRSLGSSDSITLFKSPIASSSSVSVSSGATSGIIASSRDAPTLGAVRSFAGRLKYPSMPALPVVGRSSQTLSTMSQFTTDALVQIPVRTATAGTPVTLNIVRSNSRNVLASFMRSLNRIPKRRRRQAGILSRRLATGIRAVGTAIKKIPSWVTHTAVVTTPWIFAGVEHLTTLDPNITYIHPIQRLASYERYFIAMSTLIFAQCFHDKDIREQVLAMHPTNATINLGGRILTPADIIFDVNLAVPGDTLQKCSPFFTNQYSGLGKELLLEMLSVHFDTSLLADDILFYNGPAKYIISDYTAYYNDIFPRFSPYAYHAGTASVDGAMGLVAEYNNDFTRMRRSPRTKRASYTFYAGEVAGTHGSGHPSILFNSESPFTLSVQYLLDTPRMRYEFDIMQGAHYNTSFSYYKTLRYYTSQEGVNFNNARSHSSFRVIGGITLLEIMRGMNPFDIYVPRLNVVRELISGYDMVGDLVSLRRASVHLNVNLEYCNITTILGLFYVIQYPTDLTGFTRIVKADVSTDTMKTIGSALYQTRYARVPLLLVVQTPEILSKLASMFIVHVRILEDIKTWNHYSPIMLTTSLTMISSGAYSICISKTKTHTSKYSLFGSSSSDLGWDSLFTEACDLATIHVTYDSQISEILENPNMPDRLKSILSVEPQSSYELPSGGLYDPIMSEVINMVEPSHGAELSDGIRGTKDEGRLLPGSSAGSDTPSTTTTRPRQRSTSRPIDVDDAPPPRKSPSMATVLSNYLIKESPTYAQDDDYKESTTDTLTKPEKHDEVGFARRNVGQLTILVVMVALLTSMLWLLYKTYNDKRPSFKSHGPPTTGPTEVALSPLIENETVLRIESNERVSLSLGLSQAPPPSIRAGVPTKGKLTS